MCVCVYDILDVVGTAQVYEAVYLMTTRDFKKAAALLLDCIETFNAVEICTYEQFTIYCVLLNVMTLPRADLHKRVSHQ